MPMAKTKAEQPTWHPHRIAMRCKELVSEIREAKACWESGRAKQWHRHIDTACTERQEKSAPRFLEYYSSQHIQSHRSFGFSLFYHLHAVYWRSSCHTSSTSPKNPKVTAFKMKPPLPSRKADGRALGNADSNLFKDELFKSSSLWYFAKVFGLEENAIAHFSGLLPVLNTPT